MMKPLETQKILDSVSEYHDFSFPIWCSDGLYQANPVFPLKDKGLGRSNILVAIDVAIKGGILDTFDECEYHRFSSGDVREALQTTALMAEPYFNMTRHEFFTGLDMVKAPTNEPLFDSRNRIRRDEAIPYTITVSYGAGWWWSFGTESGSPISILYQLSSDHRRRLKPVFVDGMDPYGRVGRFTCFDLDFYKKEFFLSDIIDVFHEYAKICLTEKLTEDQFKAFVEKVHKM